MHTAARAAAIAGAPVRDRSIDLLRAVALIVVVLLHAMMVGITLTDAGPVFENALETPWFAPVSWVVQIMPLFFIAGGFTAIGSWRRARERGETASSFVAGRLHRLLRPAVIALAAVGAGLVALTWAGVPADIVATAGFRISQPLWFLGVFVLVQALVPAMTAAHERRPFLTSGLLLAAVIAIDAARISAGVEAIGFLGLGAVWLLVQQLGFWLADGRIARLASRTRRELAVATLAGMLALATFGPYSADMYVNLNPPTVMLAGLGFAQLLLFSLAQPFLRRFAQHRRVAGIADALGARAMTVYLWHMPALIGLAGLLVVWATATGSGLPALESPEWWATRALWLAGAASVVAGVTVLTARFEHRPVVRAAAGPRRVAAAAALGVTGVALVFVLGMSAPVALLAAGVAALAVRVAYRAPAQPSSSTAANRIGTQPSVVRNTVSRAMTSPTS